MITQMAIMAVVSSMAIIGFSFIVVMYMVVMNKVNKIIARKCRSHLMREVLPLLVAFMLLPIVIFMILVMANITSTIIK